MSLLLDENQANYQIRAYKPGFIQINDETFTNSVIVSPNNLITNWPPQTLLSLTAEHLNIILTLKPTLLLLGTGATLAFPAVELYGTLINHGISVEIMDTHAASRTYNVLTAENRNVAAALIIA
jgi:uncharacterized protein